MCVYTCVSVYTVCMFSITDLLYILSVFPEKAIQTLLRSIMEKEKVADEKLKSTYQRMFMSDPAGGRSHSDPIVIKNNAPDNGHKANGAESSPSNQGTKFIQVASANNEAPC